MQGISETETSSDGRCFSIVVLVAPVSACSEVPMSQTEVRSDIEAAGLRYVISNLRLDSERSELDSALAIVPS